MDAWLMYDDTDRTTRPVGIFLTPNGAMEWAVKEAGDAPDTTWSWKHLDPDEIHISGVYHPIPGIRPTGWSVTYTLERATLYET